MLQLLKLGIFVNDIVELIFVCLFLFDFFFLFVFLFVCFASTLFTRSRLLKKTFRTRHGDDDLIFSLADCNTSIDIKKKMRQCYIDYIWNIYIYINIYKIYIIYKLMSSGVQLLSPGRRTFKVPHRRILFDVSLELRLHFPCCFKTCFLLKLKRVWFFSLFVFFFAPLHSPLASQSKSVRQSEADTEKNDTIPSFIQWFWMFARGKKL